MISSGAGSRERLKRTRALAISSAERSARSARAMARSSSVVSSVKIGSCIRRSRSRRRISSAEEGLPRSRRRRPCPRASRPCGGGYRARASRRRPPGAARAAAAVQERLVIVRQVEMDDEAEIGQVDAAGGDIGGHADRARPSRSDCRALLRSFWVSSPESATTEKPRSIRLACRCRTASRVWQNTMAPRLSEAHVTTPCSTSWGRS